MLQRTLGSFVLWLVCSCIAPSVHGQTISLTFDDGLDPRTEPMARVWTAQMLATLRKHRVKAMFFPAGKNIDSQEGLRTVAAWSEAGHALGNHTYSHSSFGSPRMTVEAFTDDILRQDELMNSFAGWQRRLRFPYLKEGDTAAKRDSLRAWMDAHAYAPAPVSIDTSDWYYDKVLSARLRDPRSLNRFRQLYLHHLLQRARYYDDLARRVIGRSPSHVMLLHTNQVNAAFLEDVIRAFRSRGWRIISPTEAFRDRLYAERVDTLPAGESILWALARQAGVTGLRYPAEDGAYEKPILDAAFD